MTINLPEFLVSGILEIDNEHQILFDAINKLGDPKKTKDELWLAVYDIEEYAKSHFQTEEKHMRKIGYPGIDEHIYEHQAFSEKYNELKLELEDQKMPEGYPQKLRSYLIDWLTSHYTEIDSNMVKFIKEHS